MGSKMKVGQICMKVDLLDSPCEGDIGGTLNDQKILGRRYSNGKNAKVRGLAGIDKSIPVPRSQKVGPLRADLSCHGYKDMIRILKLGKSRVGRYSNEPKAKVGDPAEWPSVKLVLS